MTNKEAAEYLSELLKDEYAFTEKDKEVFRVAIKALEQEEWIPVKYHEATQQEIEENGYPYDVCYIFDNSMPCDEEEILVTVVGRSGKRWVNQDTCYYDDCYSLDSGYDWITDILAWKPLDKPWKGEL